MNVIIGDYSLAAALLAAAVAMVASLGALKFGISAGFKAARLGIAGFTLSFGVASWALMKALYESDFSLAYVASYTERALPMGYKLSAFWAGQEGSLLFWAVLLAVMSLVFVLIQRKNESQSHAAALLVLSVVCTFFAALILFAANPFQTILAPEDGHGLNPMLQNIGMIAHPPTLFIGYAGFTIPFALMIGAMFTGKVDNEWVAQSRRWVLFSWIFLTIGIVLGAQWAYVELGWGGYWAWDPVENASLLPWLVATALLHSTVGQQQRNTFRLSNASFAAITFLLCIFGTFLTRSGVIQSVHSFQKSMIGTFFLVFLGITTLLSVVAIAMRFRRLRQQSPMEGFISKEGALLIGNTMLVLMMGLTLVGTIFPLLSEPLTGQQITLTQNFYNRAVLPFAILLLLMMGVAPLLSYGAANISELFRRLRIPAGVMVVALIVSVGMGIRNPWALSCVAAISLTIMTVISDFVTVVLSRRAGGVVKAIISTIDGNHRRYGGHLAHIGMAMIVAGVAGSSLYNTKQNFHLKVGESGTIGQYTLKLESLNIIKGKNFEGMRGHVAVMDGRGRKMVLEPDIRRYNKAEQNNVEVSFDTRLTEDIYVSLMGVEQDDSAALQVVINPLVIWIWIGGTVMVLGGIWCMLPVLGRQSYAAVAKEENGRLPAEAVS